MTLSTELRGARGGRLVEPFAFEFTTGLGEPPELTGYEPGDFALAPVDARVVVTFSEPLDVATVSQATVALYADPGREEPVRVDRRLREDGLAVVLEPVAPLAPGREYYPVVRAGLRSSAGLRFEGEFAWRFRTRPEEAPVECADAVVADGAPCDDGDPCTGPDRCQNGVCTPQSGGGCEDLTGPCGEGACDPDTGACRLAPRAEGEVCVSENPCSPPGTCRAGLCAGANPRPCAPLDGPCTLGRCNPTTLVCERVRIDDRTPCDDAEPCTFDDRCEAGTCAGTPYACERAECITGGDCDGTGGCTGDIAEGFCYVEGTCRANNTPDPDSPCRWCRVARDQRAWTVIADGTVCDDGDACTNSSACQSGACTGGQPRNCDDNEPCTLDACDPATGCLHTPDDGAPCTDDGVPCTDDLCQAGTCSHPIAAGQCLIDGDCHDIDTPATGVDGECRICDPFGDPTAWTPTREGLGCSSNPCQSGSLCRGGRCGAGRPAAEGQPCDDRDPLTVDTVCGFGRCQRFSELSFVRFDPGSFTMGAADGFHEFPAGSGEIAPDDETHHFDEVPPRLVTITRPFYLKRTEVTIVEWRSLRPDTVDPFAIYGDELPATSISWLAAVEWLNDLSRSEGVQTCYVVDGEEVTPVGGPGAVDCEGYRLPTEAEWEYAARAGVSEVRYGPVDDIAWWEGNSGNRPHSVAGKQPNAAGLYDVLGNAMEWVWDWWAIYGEDPEEDPTGPATGMFRVARGCGYTNCGDAMSGWRLPQRRYREPTDYDGTTGLRPARTAAP